MVDFQRKERYTVQDLEEIVRILRDPDFGCPWDKVQTHASIRKDFLEETCEAIEAIDRCGRRRNRDWAAMKSAIKSDLSGYLYKHTKRNPMILPVIMEI